MLRNQFLPPETSRGDVTRPVTHSFSVCSACCSAPASVSLLDFLLASNLGAVKTLHLHVDYYGIISIVPYRMRFIAPIRYQ